MAETKLPDLPPLPPLHPVPAWNADAIQAYAREYAKLAVLAERERCAKVCEAEGDQRDDYDAPHYASCAAAIRGGK